MRYILVLAITLLTYGCSSSDSGSSSKDLFSLWTEDGSGSQFDFSGGSFGGSFQFSLFFTGGEECDCNLTFIGDQSSGSWVLNSCSYVFNSGSGDPGCNAANGTGTFSKSGSVLTITDSLGNADTYR